MTKILFISTHGTDDPTKATFPFLMAKAAVEGGNEAGILLMGEAAYLMKDDIADEVHGFGVPPLKGLREYLVGQDVRISVCGFCGTSRGVSEEDFDGKNSGFGTPPDAINAIIDYDKVITI